MKNKKRWLAWSPAVLALVIAAGVIATVRHNAPDTPPSDTVPAPVVETVVEEVTVTSDSAPSRGGTGTGLAATSRQAQRLQDQADSMRRRHEQMMKEVEEHSRKVREAMKHKPELRTVPPGTNPPLHHPDSTSSAK